MSPPNLDNFLKKLDLPGDEVHILVGDLDKIILRGYEEKLPLSEKIRASKYHYQIHRNRYATRHALLRLIIGRYHGIRFYEEEFCLGEHGKPYLSNTNGRDNIYFNISNSESMGIYAFSRNSEIGVDIEYIRNISEMEQIAERFFSVKEDEFFRSLPRSQKREAFFNCWTRKEALIKALGDGLSRPLDKFDVSLVRGEPARLLRIGEDSKIASRWLIQDLKPAPGFAAALAAEGPLRCCYCRVPE